MTTHGVPVCSVVILVTSGDIGKGCGEAAVVNTCYKIINLSLPFSLERSLA
jgi:hypothetical protein